MPNGDPDIGRMEGESSEQFARGEKSQIVDHSDHLPGGLVLPEFFGRHDNSFRTGEKAEAGDQKFPADDHDNHPGGYQSKGNQTDKGGGGEDLVSQRIHEFPEIRDQIHAPGDLSIEVVRQRSEQKDQKSCCIMPGNRKRKADHEQRGQHQSEKSQYIGQVHCGKDCLVSIAASILRTSLTTQIRQ